METARSVISRVFTISAVEGRDEWDEKYDRCYAVLQSLIADVSEKEAHDSLTSAVCKDTKTHEDVCIGLLYVILTEPQNATRSYRDLTFVSRDGLLLVLNHITQVVTEKFQRLQDPVRIQLLWFLKELVRANVTGTDLLAWTILRQVAGGDVSPRNLWLAENLLDLFAEQRAWLDKYPFLIASVVYTYLRLMEDHMSPLLAGLRQKETLLCVSLMREKFADCMTVGRDLVRLLQNVARIPEIEALWRDILFNPRSLCPTFTGVLQLMQMRTSRRFLVSRLTPDMEKKMFFLTSNVRFGNQKRYQDWFQKLYLSTAESQSLRCDLIRFIVGVIHPSNEVLCSDIIPRWAVLGWLLTTCTHPVAQANAKLALFYDWLFYDAERDNIMNIEPAILVMYHSIRAHPAITATLLDFLCRIIPSFYPPLTSHVRLGVVTSLRQILEKRVLPSLQPLLENPKLDRDLRSLVTDTFPEFCASTPGNPIGLPDGMKVEDMKEVDVDNTALSINSSDGGNELHQPEPTFSDEDEDDDLPLSHLRGKEKLLDNTGVDAAPLPDLSAYLDEIQGNLRLHIDQLHTEADNEVRCLAMENLVQTVSQDPVEGEQLTALGNCLSAIFSQDMTSPILPEILNNENLEDSISRPLFVLLRCFTEMVDDESNGKTALLDVLLELHTKFPKLAYLLLYYLKASKADEDKYAAYEELCQAREKEVDECLVEDLTACSDDEVSLLCYLAPDVYSKFSEYCRNKGPLLKILVSCIDATQLFHLIGHVLQGNLTVFQKDSSLVPLLISTLDWETFEQIAVWQLLAAHNLPLTALLPLIPKLKEPDHSEALSALMLMIKDEKPTNEILKPLLSSSLETFTSVLLSYWSSDSSTANALSNVLASQFNSSLNLNGSTSLTGSQSSPGKRKRTTMNSLSASTTFKTAPTPGAGVDSNIETMLKHVEILRSTLAAVQVPKGKQPAEMRVFSQDSLQQALQNVQQICDDSQKKKFSDLFSLIDSNDEPEVNSRRSGGRGVKRTAQRAAQSTRGRTSLKEESDEESSEEEVIIKQRQTKKRRKTNLVGSDSD